MAQVTKTETFIFDRRQIYRPFLERLNPIALNRSVAQRKLMVVPPRSDPRDPNQPPIYEVFAGAAELNRGTQMALVGGIGSGKTTELLLTMDRLKRHDDAVNVFLDAAEFTDFSETNPGALLAAIGLRLFARISKRFGEPSEQVQSAGAKLRRLALGTTVWQRDDGRDDGDGDYAALVNVPGLMKPRFPELKERVAEVMDLLGEVLMPFLEHDCQITVKWGIYFTQVTPRSCGCERPDSRDVPERHTLRSHWKRLERCPRAVAIFVARGVARCLFRPTRSAMHIPTAWHRRVTGSHDHNP